MKTAKKKRTPKPDLYQNLNRDNPRHAKVFRFIDEYPIDLNATKAAERAGYAKSSARTTGAQLLANPNIKKVINEKMAEIAKRNEFEQDQAIQFWKAVAFQDPRRFKKPVIRACRCCHHPEFLYQYTKPEFKRAIECHEKFHAELLKEDAHHVYQEFDEKGGDTYDWRLKPNNDCPECFGDGVFNFKISDVDDLTEEELLVYKGMKQTKDGFEVLLVDREKGYEALSRYVGLYENNNKFEVSGKIDPEDLTRRYCKNMQAAKDRHERMINERAEFIRDNDLTISPSGNVFENDYD